MSTHKLIVNPDAAWNERLRCTCGDAKIVYVTGGSYNEEESFDIYGVVHGKKTALVVVDDDGSISSDDPGPYTKARIELVECELGREDLEFVNEEEWLLN